MTIPKPGKPVRGSRSGRPIMALLDLLGRRWVLRIIWELRDGVLSYVALRVGCDDMSTSVLSQRLTELKEAGIVIQTDGGDYTLSAEGRSLLHALLPLNDWAERWSQREREG
ncbi:MAG: helix-turn-helix domain-containing protein [Anaerolineae bacterium]